uniref:SFRICE_014738 n=1 Tax=Spodoptera frugiperda TaxID=7108 RepID=A0A2H1VK30_SPOFR
MKTLKSGASRGRECLSRTPQRNKSEVIIRGEEKKQVMGRPTSLPTPSGWYVEPKAFSIPLSPLTIGNALLAKFRLQEWDAVSSFCKAVMLAKEEAECVRERSSSRPSRRRRHFGRRGSRDDLWSRTADRDTDNLMDNHTTLVMRTIQLRYRDIGSKQE